MKPVNVLGAKVDPNDVERIVRNQLESGSTWSSRDDMDSSAGLSRAIDAVRGSPLEQSFVRAALKSVMDPNPKVRLGALLTMRSYGRQIDAAPSLLAAWRDHPELFRGVEVGLPENDLESLLLSAIAAAAQPRDKTVLDTLHQLVRDPTKRDLVFAGLARSDPDWVVTHVSDWLDGNANRIAAILFNVADKAKVEQLVRAISKAPPEVRAGAVGVIKRFVQDPDRAAHLISLLG